MGITKFKLCYLDPLIRINALCSAHAGIRPVGYSYDGESHDFWESVFILKGVAGITAGETVYTLREGQMIFHPPGEFHRLWNAGDEFLRIVIISFSASSFPTDRHRICSFTKEHDIFSISRELRKCFETDGIFLLKPRSDVPQGNIQKTVNSLEAMFIDILENHSDNGVDGVYTDKFSQLYTDAIITMKSNLGTRLSAENIATSCGVSVSTLQKLFFRYTGMGLMKYYEGVRMQHAQTLIDNGYLIKEVASALGYDDQNYFSTAYKRYFGTSPKKNTAKGENNK